MKKVVTVTNLNVHTITKVSMTAHTLCEDNICLHLGLVIYFLLGTCITTQKNSVFPTHSTSSPKMLEVIFLLQRPMKWHCNIWLHTSIDIIGMCCELGNSIGAQFIWLDPRAWRIFIFWDTFHQRGSTMEKVFTVSILNVHIPFQRFPHLHMPCGKTIHAWIMDWTLIHSIAAAQQLKGCIFPCFSHSMSKIWKIFLSHQSNIKLYNIIWFHTSIDIIGMCCDLEKSIGPEINPM